MRVQVPLRPPRKNHAHGVVFTCHVIRERRGVPRDRSEAEILRGYLNIFRNGRIDFLLKS